MYQIIIICIIHIMEAMSLTIEVVSYHNLIVAIITLNQAIALIKQSVGDEKEDEMFYDILIEQAPTDKEKNIIKSIRNDERKHNQILKRIIL